MDDTHGPGLRWWLRQPLTSSAALFGVAALAALAGRSLWRPEQAVAVAAVIAGGAVLVAAVPFSHRRGMLLGTAVLSWAVWQFARTGPDGSQTVPAVVLLAVAGAVLVRGRRTWARVLLSVALVAAAVLLWRFAFDVLPLLIALSSAAAASVWLVGLIGWASRGNRGSRALVAPVDALEVGRSVLAERSERVEGADELAEKLLFVGPDGRERTTRFFVLMGFASSIASFGVLVDSAAVVIGAMLMAPLMSPLLGISLGFLLGRSADLRRVATLALVGSVLTVAIAAVAAAVVGAGADLSDNAEIAARTSPTIVDLYVALLAGAAGAYALSRRDVSDSLPGVAVAIALVPPLAVVGVSAQQGDAEAALGALVLFATNALAIIGMGALTFAVTGIRADRQASEPVGGRTRASQVSMVLGGALVLAVLLTNGSSQAFAGFRATRVGTAVEEWLDGDDFVVDSIVVDGQTVEITLFGTGSPDGLDDLSTTLAGVLDANVDVTLRVVQTEVVTSTSG